MSDALTSEMEYLLSARAIRDRASEIFKLALNGRTHFQIHLDRLPKTADFVLQTIRKNYPGLNIPFHSRWGHFQAGGVDRLGILRDRLGRFRTPDERIRSLIDLAVVSVLLDAGAGMNWRFEEPNGRLFSKSEGLAVASFHIFTQGQFSSHPTNPLQADSSGLAQLSSRDLASGFQISSTNPLEGIEGRYALLGVLARALKEQGLDRPGDLLDRFRSTASQGRLRASDILNILLKTLGSIWPGLGDIWPHTELEKGKNLVPFHKLSQWLSYSLIEPLMESGLEVVDLDELTGLAEYRNGGLILDLGLIELRDPDLALQTHRIDSDLVIEWRALTVVFLDRIADQIRKSLNRSREELPLVKVLEGGTWRAGREIASQLRPDGGPPLKIQSDGTVF